MAEPSSSNPPMPPEINLEHILEDMCEQNAIPIRKLTSQEEQTFAANYTPLIVAGVAAGIGTIGMVWRGVQNIFTDPNLWHLNFASASDAAKVNSGIWKLSKLKDIPNAFTTSLMDAGTDGRLTGMSYITRAATSIPTAAQQAMIGISSLVMHSVQVYQLHQVNKKIAEIDSKLRWFETRDCAELISLFKKCTELSKRYASLLKGSPPKQLLDSFDRDLSVVDMTSSPIHEKLVIELDELLPALGLERKDNEIRVKPREEEDKGASQPSKAQMLAEELCAKLKPVFTKLLPSKLRDAEKDAPQSSKAHTLKEELCAKAKPVITKLIWSIRTKLALVALRTTRDTQNEAEPEHLEVYQDRLKELQGLTKDISTILRIISEAQMLKPFFIFLSEVDKKQSVEVQKWAREMIDTLHQAVNPPTKNFSLILAKSKASGEVRIFALG